MASPARSPRSSRRSSGSSACSWCRSSASSSICCGHCCGHSRTPTRRSRSDRRQPFEPPVGDPTQPSDPGAFFVTVITIVVIVAGLILLAALARRRYAGSRRALTPDEEHEFVPPSLSVHLPRWRRPARVGAPATATGAYLAFLADAERAGGAVARRPNEGPETHARRVADAGLAPARLACRRLRAGALRGARSARCARRAARSAAGSDCARRSAAGRLGGRASERWSGSLTVSPVSAARSAASTISTAARPSAPLTAGARPAGDRVDEVLGLIGERAQPLGVERVGEVVERRLDVDRLPRDVRLVRPERGVAALRHPDVAVVVALDHAVRPDQVPQVAGARARGWAPRTSSRSGPSRRAPVTGGPSRSAAAAARDHRRTSGSQPARA